MEVRLERVIPHLLPGGWVEMKWIGWFVCLWICYWLWCSVHLSWGRWWWKRTKRLTQLLVGRHTRFLEEFTIRLVGLIYSLFTCRILLWLTFSLWLFGSDINVPVLASEIWYNRILVVQLLMIIIVVIVIVTRICKALTTAQQSLSRKIAFKLGKEFAKHLPPDCVSCQNQMKQSFPHLYRSWANNNCLIVLTSF